MINLDSKAFTIAFWIGIGLLCVGAASNVDTSWASVFVLSALAAVSIVVLMLPFVPRAFAVLFVIIAIIDGAGFAWDLFRRLAPFYDKSSHFYSALVMAWAFGYWSYKSHPPQTRLEKLMFTIRICCYSFSVGAFWEIIEWPGGIMGDAVDTAGDLLADLCGAVIGSATMLLAMQRHWITRVPVEPISENESALMPQLNQSQAHRT